MHSARLGRSGCRCDRSRAGRGEVCDSKLIRDTPLPDLSRTRAEEILKRARDRRVVVLGDVMLDEFIWGDVTRISPEAPVPVVSIKRESTHLGGAANVLANITAMGAKGNVVGVVGRDSAAEKIRASLRQDGGVQTDDLLIADHKRPTTIKTRIIAHNQMVVRADREHRGAVNDSSLNR